MHLLVNYFEQVFKRAFYCYLSTNNQQIVIQEKTVIKRNIGSTINNNINHYPQPNRITTISRSCNQHLTVQTRPSDLSNRQNRFLSLAPTASIFISEISTAPDT